MEQKISIIVPVFNAKPYLQRMFDSFTAQTIGFGALHVFLADDCSTDGSWEMLLEWQNRYPNVTALRTRVNTGWSSAPRNLALDRLDTPYVMFCDNDDWYEDDACELLLSAIEGTDAGLATGYFRRVGPSGQPLEDKTPDCLADRDTDYLLPQDLKDCLSVNGIFWCKIFRTEIIRGAGLSFDETSRMEDVLFHAQYLQQCGHVRFINRLIYNWRQRTGEHPSLSNTVSYQYLFTRADDFEKLRRICGGDEFAAFFENECRPEYYIHLILHSTLLSGTEQKALLLHWKPLIRMMADRDSILPGDFRTDTIRMLSELLTDPSFLRGDNWHQLLETVTENLELKRKNHNLYAEIVEKDAQICRLQKDLTEMQSTVTAIRNSRSYRVAHNAAKLLHRKEY